MTTVDLTIELLKQIRDGVHGTNARLDETKAELSARIDETRTELSARIDETRTELSARIDRTRTEFLEALWSMDARIERLDARVESLDARVESLDARVESLDARVEKIDHRFAESIGIMRALTDKDDRLAAELADLRRRVEALEDSPPRSTA
jgi:chromosome segregation ATPase